MFTRNDTVRTQSAVDPEVIPVDGSRRETYVQVTRRTAAATPDGASSDKEEVATPGVAPWA
jgi:hypothetical protein